MAGRYGERMGKWCLWFMCFEAAQGETRVAAQASIAQRLGGLCSL